MKTYLGSRTEIIQRGRELVDFHEARRLRGVGNRIISFFKVAKRDESPSPQEQIIIIPNIQSAPRQAFPMNFPSSYFQVFENEWYFCQKVEEIKRFTRRI